MRNTLQKGAVLFLGVLLGASLFSPVVVAGSADVGIEPAYPKADNERTQSIFIMQLKPEEQGKEGIHLVNSGKEARTVEIYPTDSSYSVDGSFSCRQHAEAVKDVGTWVKLDKTKLTLQSGEQTVVNFTVDVPKNTGPGEHDGCIAVQDVANLPAKSGSGVLLGFRSAIRLAVTVPGKIVKHLTITRVDIKHVENRGVSVSPVAKNSGNVSLDVRARAQLVSIFGQETEIKSGAKYPIMQGATTGWAYIFDGPYWGGVYKARTSLSYNADPKSGLGQDESNQQRVRKDSGWFFVMPDPLAGAAELAVIVAIFWIIGTPLRRRFHGRRVSKRWQKYVVNEGDSLAMVAKQHGIHWKKLAKHNHIKAPYLIEPGHSLVVPKPKAKKSTGKSSKKATTSLDWLSDDQPTMPSEPQQPAAIEVAPLKPSEPQQPLADAEWHSPQELPESASQKSYTAQKTHSVHVVTENPLFPEPEDMSVPDWRDGASEDELRQFGVISDSASVAPIHNAWSIDDEQPKTEPVKRKATKKRTTTAVKGKTPKKPSRKTSGGASTKKK